MAKAGKRKRQVCFKLKDIPQLATMLGSDYENGEHTLLSKADIPEIMAAVTEVLKAANKTTPHNHHTEGESSSRHSAGE